MPEAPTQSAYVAFDLGAESGRAMLAVLDHGSQSIALHEAHRFPNLPQRLPSGYHWNLLDLWANLVDGLQRCGEIAREKSLTITSLGVDTWGVDFGLVGKSGQLLGLPFAYRDDSHVAAMQKAFDKIGEKNIYDHTGIQFMPFNSLFQLIARKDAEPAVTKHADKLLFIPDLLHYFFSGVMKNEATIASTSQMIDASKGSNIWAADLLESLDLPTDFLGDIVPAGTKIGTIRKHIADRANVAPDIAVIAPPSHDTASAIAATPADRENSENWAYLSSGTWSLMGVELDKPLISDATRDAGFTNERGVADSVRFLKNISGLWLVQQVRRDLEKIAETRPKDAERPNYDYPTLTALAAEAEPFRTLIDPDHPPFAAPGDMMQKLADFANKTNQPVPATPGQAVRCCLESLALTYRRVHRQLEELTDQKIETLHLIGGGGKNELLNQMTADALGIPVIVGPYEGTAVGNALTQAIGAGHVRDLAHLRQIVKNSFDLKTFTPAPPTADAHTEQAERFAKLLKP